MIQLHCDTCDRPIFVYLSQSGEAAHRDIHPDDCQCPYTSDDLMDMLVEAFTDDPLTSIQ